MFVMLKTSLLESSDVICHYYLKFLQSWFDLVDFGGFQRSSGVIHYDRPRGGLHDATTSD